MVVTSAVPISIPSTRVPAVPIGRALICLSVASLGAISLFVGDFAYQWQAVPESVVARETLARLTGFILIVTSALLAYPRTARIGALSMTIVFALWTLLFQVPRMFRGEVAAWLGVFEFAAMAAACWALFGLLASLSDSSHSYTRAVTAGRVCFALCLPAFGLSHFLYAEPAAALLPAWMPAAIFLTYLTGAGHVAAGLSLASGILMRLAAPLLCAMLASFVLLLHLPRVLANPASRYEWTMILVSLALNGAAWVIAAAVTHRPNYGPLETTN